MEGDAGDGSEDTLSSQGGRAKPTRGERKDLEGHKFGEYHNEPGKSELDHWHPVLQGFAVEAAPALISVDEADVEEEEDRHEDFGDRDCDWGADEAPFQFPDEDVVHECVQRCTYEENIHRGAEKALGLQISFPGFKGGISGSAKNEDFEVEAG